MRVSALFLAVFLITAGLVLNSDVAGSAPAGFRLPFVGRALLTQGEHQGHAIDYAPALTADAWNGTIRAAEAGRVIVASLQTGNPPHTNPDPCPGDPFTFGNLVVIQHDGPPLRHSYYAHLSSFAVSSGDVVTKGQVLGSYGETGCATGPHLHFEVREGVTSNQIYTGTNVGITDIPGTDYAARVAVGPPLDTTPTPTPTPTPHSPLDFNGDGKADAITFNQAGQGVVTLSTGSGFGAASVWGPVFTWGEIPAVADFNGDGSHKADVVTFNQQGHAIVSLSTGSAFQGASDWGPVFTWDEIPAVGDFNGDGKADAITFNQAGQGVVTLTNPTGTGFLPASVWGPVFTWSEIPATGDFNGGGKADAITFNQAGQGVVTLTNPTGTGFLPASVWGPVFTWGEIPGGFQTFAWHKIFKDSDFDLACNPGQSSSLCSGTDNCPDTYNPDQLDNNGDGVGDACSTSTPTPPPTTTGTPSTSTPTGTAVSSTGRPTSSAVPQQTSTPTRTPTPTASRTPTPSAHGDGDASCDGGTNALDAALILQYVGGLLTSLPCAGNADVNGDGSATAVDAAIVLQYVAGLLASLPI